MTKRRIETGDYEIENSSCVADYELEKLFYGKKRVKIFEWGYKQARVTEINEDNGSDGIECYIIIDTPKSPPNKKSMKARLINALKIERLKCIPFR